MRRSSRLLVAFGLVAASCAHGGDLLPRPDVVTELRELLPRINRALVFYDFEQKEKAEVFDPKWLEALTQVLELSDTPRDGLCFCVSTPWIELYEDDQRLVTLSVHHKNRLRVLTEEAGDDFLVGERTGTDVIAMIMEKRTLVVRPLPKVPPLPPPKFDVKM